MGRGKGREEREQKEDRRGGKRREGERGRKRTLQHSNSFNLKNENL